MKKVLLTCFVLFSFLSGKADNGEEIYLKRCSACHTIGEGRGIGPDLRNITQHHTKKWLTSFIQSPSTMVKNGDSAAVAVYNEFNKFPMPEQALSAEQIKSILDYIDLQSSKHTINSTKSQKVENSYSPQDISQGFRFFTGKQRLSNRGISCISCHKVQDKRIFVGGDLAKDLSHTYKMLGATGISAILKSPPFPVMKAAYKNNPIKKEEIIALSAYLKSVSSDKTEAKVEHSSYFLLILGTGIFILIIFSTLILYRKRKKNYVNQEIYNRQSH